MRLYIKILILVFMCLLALDMIAQKSKMTFDYLTTKNGLSQNRISCILRDSRDNMWFGTFDGLNKYNGSQVTIYRNQSKNPQSISCERITDIHEDSEKNVWVATEDGLNLYVSSRGSFSSFKNIPSDSSSISGNYINCIYSDKQHNVWIGVGDGNAGLNKWEPQSKTFTRYQINCSKDTLMENAVTGIVQDNNGNIWVASWADGIFRFDPDKEKFFCYKDPSFNSSGIIKRLFVDNDNTIWIATYGAGLFSFNPANSKFTKYNTLGDGKGTSGKLIFDIIQEDRNNLLIAIDQGGINRFNKQTKLFEYINYEPDLTGGLNSNGIWCLYKDKEGILWVGTSVGGVNIYNSKSKKFKLISNIHSDSNSLSYDVVGSIYEDNNGLLWIATDGGGISVYNPKTQNFKNYRNDSNDPSSLPCNVIRHVVEDKKHNYWIGTWDGGLIKLDRETDKFTQYWPESNKPFNISGRTIWYHVVDHKGIIWLSVTEFGVDLLDPEMGIIKKFRPNQKEEGALSHKYVNFLYEDSQFNMWLCTPNGVNLFDSVTNSFKIYNNFPSNNIKSFIEDKEGCYWAGTINEGIVRFKQNGVILNIYNTSNGLPSNLINGILEDENNNIWVSTGGGISRINYKSGKIRNYSESDGLQGNQFFLHSCLKTRSGEMYFGGFNGINSFFPDSLKDNDYIPPVYINEFLIFNKPVTVNSPNSPLQKVIEQTSEIELSWKQSVFSFGFMAINYTHPEKNQYAYKMEGFDKNWIYTDADRRLATYTNLNPGTYTFHVKASNNDGVWNEQGASVKIVITPPFWKTLCFKGATILSIIVLIYSWIRFRLKRARLKSLKFEALVKKRTTQLELANKKLEFANKELEAFSYSVSHDLRAPLRSIDGFSHILLDKYKDKIDDQGKKHLHNLRTASKRMSHLIDDMLKLSRVSSGELNIRQINLSLLVNEIANEFQVAEPERKVKFIIQDNIIINADGRLFRIVLENLIGNAWKYTSKHSTACIEFGMSQNKKEPVYFIRDDGAGFDMKYAQKLFGAFQRMHNTKDFEGTGVGLATVQRIIHRHSGKVWAESQVEKGATFYFTV